MKKNVAIIASVYVIKTEYIISEGIKLSSPNASHFVFNVMVLLTLAVLVFSFSFIFVVFQFFIFIFVLQVPQWQTKFHRESEINFFFSLRWKATNIIKENVHFHTHNLLRPCMQ